MTNPDAPLDPSFTAEERRRIHHLAYASKSGTQLTPEEMRFLQDMFYKNTEEYKEVSRKAHKEAVETAYPWLKEGRCHL